jgi:hypothetical protein
VTVSCNVIQYKPGDVAKPGDVDLSRGMWLSPVIQATGRQEQWDGSRWNDLTNSNRWISVAALWPAIRRHDLKCASEPHDENSLLDSLARQLL